VEKELKLHQINIKTERRVLTGKMKATLWGVYPGHEGKGGGRIHPLKRKKPCFAMTTRADWVIIGSACLQGRPKKTGGQTSSRLKMPPAGGERKKKGGVAFLRGVLPMRVKRVGGVHGADVLEGK